MSKKVEFLRKCSNIINLNNHRFLKVIKSKNFKEILKTSDNFSKKCWKLPIIFQKIFAHSSKKG